MPFIAGDTVPPAVAPRRRTFVDRLLAWVEIALLALISFFVVANVVAWSALFSGVVDSGHAILADAGPVDGLTPSLRAERDTDPALPGVFVPPETRSHIAGAWPRFTRVPFCPPGVISNQCYSSNPPTSGLHLGVQQNARLDGGRTINIPPDPGLYDVVIPREAIPHLEEHGGVYVGYNCSNDTCAKAVEAAKAVVRQELALGGRVVMSPDPDLAPDEVAIVSWTRIDTFAAADYTDARVRSFIKAHSCRFDPENLCPAPVFS